ncbi:hypothetical protein ZWY2020_022566 [Hordeum vulgare]|nr:hypothetical protein ZWY2020_022566 [Hordeum vulgare]
MPVAVAASGDTNVVEDLYGILRVLSDGTVVRSPDQPEFCPITFPCDHPSVQWKEAVYDKGKNLRVRMYKPSGGGEQAGRKLPVLVHYHGGGFCLGSCTWGNIHSFCLRLAAEAGAVVLSAGYRLAPEHRLPAALDDAAGFLEWLRERSVSAEGEDRWLTEAADFGRVFVTGDSAGGTLAHHLAVRAGTSAAPKHGDGVDSLTIKGYILLMPFFGGVDRTRSEAVEFPLAETPFLNLAVLDRFWRLSLPEGASRDHPIANPFGADSPALGSVEFPPVLVVSSGTDLLHDRTVDYAERLARMGKPLEVVDFPDDPHGFFTQEPWSETTGELIRLVSVFVADSCVAVAAPKTA